MFRQIPWSASSSSGHVQFITRPDGAQETQCEGSDKWDLWAPREEDYRYMLGCKAQREILSRIFRKHSAYECLIYNFECAYLSYFFTLALNLSLWWMFLNDYLLRDFHCGIHVIWKSKLKIYVKISKYIEATNVFWMEFFSGFKLRDLMFTKEKKFNAKWQNI